MSHENNPMTSKMCGFALNLDLTHYFEDLRKYSSVFVDLSKFKKVSDVEKHIKFIFKLEDIICLTNKKFLIPSCEDIQILQQFETLKVQKCDFFDQQIHKDKRANPDCDQTALNLIQTERTIDLSCRPKQRLKINICKSHGFSATSLTPFIENAKIQPISSTPSTSANGFFDESCQIKSKEKQRNKIKGRHLLKDENNMEIDVETSVDILDMSVNKPVNKNYLNCFSTAASDGSVEIELPSKLDKKNNSDIPFEISVENSTNESHRKSKKRKKQLKYLQDHMDSYNSQCDTLASDNGSNPSDGVKRRKRKSSISINYDENICRNEENEDHIHNSTTSYVSQRKKHKKKKKWDEYTDDIENAHAMCNGKAQIPEKNTESYVTCERTDVENIYRHTSKEKLEEHKEILLKRVENLSLFAKFQGNELDSNRFISANKELEGSPRKKSNKLKARDIDVITNPNIGTSTSVGQEIGNTAFCEDHFSRKHKETNKNYDILSNTRCYIKEKGSEIINESKIKHNKKSHNKSISKNNSSEHDITDEEQVTELYKPPIESNDSSLGNGTAENSCNISSGKANSINDSAILTEENSNDELNVISHSDSLETKTRRKRIRRHNKKKKRESKVLLSAVGPVLNKITSEIQVKTSQSSTDARKHIFFHDNDVAETVTSSAAQSNVQDTAGKVDTRNVEVTTTEQGAVNKSTSWQEELLKLACNSSKPAVFHRGSATTSEKSKPSQTLSIGVNDSSDLQKEIVTKGFHDSKSFPVDNNVSERTSKVLETSNSCNGETEAADETQMCSGTKHNHSDSKKLPEVVKPLPNDIQNIILTNYPIIDKVVAEDLILFKVLKLNESKQPDMSKTILAKVNNASMFPEKICLQIMEGCEECGTCEKVVGNGGEVFLIELRWTDILEPRLFYP